jgi:hypothetical protein
MCRMLNWNTLKLELVLDSVHLQEGDMSGSLFHIVLSNSIDRGTRIFHGKQNKGLSFGILSPRSWGIFSTFMNCLT